jgi:hypothetical protein
MNPIIEDLKILETKICNRLTEVEQHELHNLILCLQQKVEGLQELATEGCRVL